jgi:hypothetical protein
MWKQKLKWIARNAQPAMLLCQPALRCFRKSWPNFLKQPDFSIRLKSQANQYCPPHKQKRAIWQFTKWPQPVKGGKDLIQTTPLTGELLLDEAGHHQGADNSDTHQRQGARLGHAEVGRGGAHGSHEAGGDSGSELENWFHDFVLNEVDGSVLKTLFSKHAHVHVVAWTLSFSKFCATTTKSLQINGLPHREPESAIKM